MFQSCAAVRMNLHRLGIFSYVARHRGIAGAVRGMPYGIQQPAVSEQIKLLEEEVGARLFERRPFRLTREGRFLYAPLESFMAELERRMGELRLRRKPHLWLGAEQGLEPSLVLPVINSLLQLEPAVGIDLQTGTAEQLRQTLQDGAVDLVITTLAGRPPRGLACRVITKRPLVLLVPKAMPIRTADHFWSQRTVSEPLIASAAGHAVSQAFQLGLRRGDITWQARVTAHSLAGVASMAAAGLGIGVALALPDLIRHPRVRVLPLAGFDPVPIACLWRQPDTSRLKAPLQFMEQRARALADARCARESESESE